MVKVQLRDGSTVEVSKDVAKIYKKLRKLSKESKEQDKRFLESLSPEQREQHLEFQKRQREKYERMKEFEEGLSEEDLKLRKSLLYIGSFFHKQRTLEKAMSRSAPSGFWDVIFHDEKIESEEMRDYVKHYRKEQEGMNKELMKAYDEVKHYPISKYKEVLFLPDERYPFYVMNNIEHFRDKKEKYEEKKGIRLKDELSRDESE